MSVASDTPTTTKRADATGTVGLRRRFIREMSRRWTRLRGLVRRTVGYENDAANLSRGGQRGRVSEPPYTGQPEAVEAFPSLTEGILTAAFAAWIANATRQIVLDPTTVTDAVSGAADVVIPGMDIPAPAWNHWTRDYVGPAFVRGVNQSTGLLYRAGVDVENIPNEEILTDGGFVPAVRQRYWSPFEQLEGLTDDAADEMARIFDEAIAEGWNPRKTADEMTANLRSLEADRAYTIARTETLFSHSNAAIENYRRAGVDTVGHVGRIVTPDDALCPFCRRLADETFTLTEFTGTRVLWRGTEYFVGCPAHPNGRCAPIPKPGIDADELPPLEDRVPGTVIGVGFDLYGSRDQPAFN